MAGMKRNHRHRVAAGLAATAALGTAAMLARGGDRPAQAEPAGDAEATTSKQSEMRYGAVVGSAWDLPETRNDRVDFFIEFLMTKKRDKMHEWLERLGRYAPMIQAELRERGMPEDLVFLAMMESGLDPNAYSRADAAGMWQFIEETGERYGLEVSRDVDERRDPIEATGAALDYLQELHERFGSWYLAAAAYNTGENRIDRILRERAGGARGDENLYWQISPHIPRETRDYVPLMLAAGYIAKNPAKYGFTNLKYQEPLAFDEVEVPGGVDFDVIATAAGVNEDALRDLNPHLVRDRTPAKRAWTVRLPAGHRQQFAANFEAALTGGPKLATQQAESRQAGDNLAD